MIPIVAGVIFYRTFNSPEFLENLPEDINMILVWMIALILIGVLVLALWLFYKLIYGILLSKLKVNYKELVSNGNL